MNCCPTIPVAPRIPTSICCCGACSTVPMMRRSLQYENTSQKKTRRPVARSAGSYRPFISVVGAGCFIYSGRTYTTDLQSRLTRFRSMVLCVVNILLSIFGCFRRRQAVARTTWNLQNSWNPVSVRHRIDHDVDPHRISVRRELVEEPRVFRLAFPGDVGVARNPWNCAKVSAVAAITNRATSPAALVRERAAMRVTSCPVLCRATCRRPSREPSRATGSTARQAS